MLCGICAPLDLDRLYELSKPRDSEKLSDKSPCSKSASKWRQYISTPPSRKKYLHHANYIDLVQSVETGCSLCTLVLYTDIQRRRLRTSSYRNDLTSPWTSLVGAKLLNTNESKNRVTIPANMFWSNASLQSRPWTYEIGEWGQKQIYVSMQYLKRDGEDEDVETRCPEESVENVNLVFWQEMEGVGIDVRGRTMYVCDKGGYVWDEFLCRLQLAVDEGAPLVSDFIRNRPPVSDYKSQESIDLIRKWMGICEENHPICRILESPVLPTRVIDVGPSDGSEDPKLFLTHGTRGHWIALSHCWGNILPVLLTTVTESSFCQKIPDLPPTFQDAVFLTRKLGLRYLWIDSLCIIQDSIEDWMKEAAVMGKIYQDSFLSIQINARDSSKSVLVKDYGETAGFELPFNMKSTNIQGILYLGGSTETSTTSEPNSRAWILQEYILAPRTLACSANGLIWSCRQQMATLRCPRPFKNWSFIPRHYAGESLRWHFKKVFWDEKSDTVHTYYSLVSEYMSRRITRRTDRLVAWSAIPQKVGKEKGWEYYAGIWKEDIHRGLLWCTDGRDISSISDKPFVAPTWSWARMLAEDRELYDGKEMIVYGHEERGFFREMEPGSGCTVIDAQNEYEGEDKYGKVSSAKLVLEGYWIPAEKLHANSMPHILLGGSPIDRYTLTDTGKGLLRTTPAFMADSYLHFTPDDSRSIICDFDLRYKLEKQVIGYQYTEEEKRALKEWSRISYFQVAKWKSDLVPDGTVWALILCSDDGEGFWRVGLAQIGEGAVGGWEKRRIDIF